MPSHPRSSGSRTLMLFRTKNLTAAAAAVGLLRSLLSQSGRRQHRESPAIHCTYVLPELETSNEGVKTTFRKQRVTCDFTVVIVFAEDALTRPEIRLTRREREKKKKKQLTSRSNQEREPYRDVQKSTIFTFHVTCHGCCFRASRTGAGQTSERVLFLSVNIQCARLSDHHCEIPPSSIRTLPLPVEPRVRGLAKGRRTQPHSDSEN